MYVQQHLCLRRTELAVQGSERDVQLLGLLLVASVCMDCLFVAWPGSGCFHFKLER